MVKIANLTTKELNDAIDELEFQKEILAKYSNIEMLQNERVLKKSQINLDLRNLYEEKKYRAEIKHSIPFRIARLKKEIKDFKTEIIACKITGCPYETLEHIVANKCFELRELLKMEKERLNNEKELTR